MAKRNKHDKTRLLAKFLKKSVHRVQGHLQVLEFKVVLNPMYEKTQFLWFELKLANAVRHELGDLNMY